jgi:hypothetical protein
MVYIYMENHHPIAPWQLIRARGPQITGSWNPFGATQGVSSVPVRFDPRDHPFSSIIFPTYPMD